MKKCVLISLAALSVSIVGCRNNSYRNDIVKETYIHKYGVPVSKANWIQNGEDGQIARVRKDGVTVTRNFVGGILQGKTTYSFPHSDTIHVVENYDQGKILTRVTNYPSGVPMHEESFDGSDFCEVAFWYEEGVPSAVEIYRKDGYLLSGEYRTPLNVIESTVEDGVGTRIVRGSDGVLIAQDSIQNGQMTEKMSYSPDGEPAMITPYLHGRMHGTRLTFLSGGLPSTIEEWTDGQQEGMTLFFENGEKIAEAPYVQGIKHGVELRYRGGSILVEEISWKQGIQHGPRKIIIDDTVKTEWYHQGKLVSRNTYERMNLR